MSSFVALDHPRFHRADRNIFVVRVVADCMSHQCRILEPARAKLDACCQYGVDADLAERDAILAKRDGIAARLRPAAATQPWFEVEVEVDADFPSAAAVRTTTFGDGCVFLAHDLRGCAIHRTALEDGWDIHGVKPHVCRLFPLSYESDAIVISDDYRDYSCSRDDAAPTVYRVARDAIAEIFGHDLVSALDSAEAKVAGQGTRLRAL